MKIKVKSKNPSQSKKRNDELYTFLDLLSASGYYGEVTLYFQNGSFEHIKETTRISKNSLIKNITQIQKQKKNNKSMKEHSLQLLLPLFLVCKDSKKEG